VPCTRPRRRPRIPLHSCSRGRRTSTRTRTKNSRVAYRAGKSARETGPSAALLRAAHTGSIAPPAPPGIRTGLTRVFPGACGATRSAPPSHRRGCARKRTMPDVGGTPAPIAFRPNACRGFCISKCSWS
jgi:hypothetical protein